MMDLPPASRSTDGLAQPSGYGGAEQCSSQPRLRPEEGDDRRSHGSQAMAALPWGGPAAGR